MTLQPKTRKAIHEFWRAVYGREENVNFYYFQAARLVRQNSATLELRKEVEVENENRFQ